MTNSDIITLYPAEPEVYVVQSFKCGSQGVYGNFPAAKKFTDELNSMDPDDHCWIEAYPLRSN